MIKPEKKAITSASKGGGWIEFDPPIEVSEGDDIEVGDGFVLVNGVKHVGKREQP